ncbi:MAG TPA: hypothetical protein VGG92_13830 [Caulobacteraceae bacterium]
MASLWALVAATIAHAQPFTAGERHLTATAPAAALRNRGDASLRITLWYPATARETQAIVGPVGSPIFILGAVARDAPFADIEKRPVVLLSHGLGGSARQLTWLGSALARRGYVAIAVDHPGENSIDGISDVGAYTPWARAGDLSAALDAVLSRPDLASHADSARVGVAGFALGAYAALLEAGARSRFANLTAFCAGPRRDAMCDKQLEYPFDDRERREVLARPALRELVARENATMRDRRIRALFLIGPAFMQALAAPSLKRLDLPVGIVFGDADPIAPVATNGAVAARLIPGATTQVLRGVGHYEFISECGPGGPRVVGPLCTDGPESSRADAHAKTEGAAIAFFDATLGVR